MVTSMISISLENRFNILPKGVVSKKLIGEYNIRSSILEEKGYLYLQLIRVTFDSVVLTVFFTVTFIQKNLNLFLREIDKYHWGEMVLFFKGIFFYLECNLVAAIRVPIITQEVAIMTKIAWSKPKTPYTVKYLFLVGTSPAKEGDDIYVIN